MGYNKQGRFVVELGDKTAGELARFEAEVRGLIKDMPAENVLLFQRRLVATALAAVVRRTPVDEGPTREGWQVSIGEIPAAPPPPKRGKPTATDLRSGRSSADDALTTKGLTAIANLPPFQIVWISNPSIVAQVLEEGAFEPPNPGPSKDRREFRKGQTLVSGGYSTQAPRGMVAITVEELRDKLHIE